MSDIDLIRYPVFSDKAKILLKQNKYVFLVDGSLKKNLLKILFEETFDVKVISINSFNLPSKSRGVGRSIGYKSNYKKVILKVDNNTPISFLQGS